MIEPMAVALGIPETNVFANRILFNEDGTYCGWCIQLHTITIS